MDPLDDNMVDELGLSELPEHLRRHVLTRFSAELQRSVGKQIADRLTAKQSRKLDAFIADGDDASAIRLLDRKVPERREIAQAELGRLKEQLRAVTPQLLKAAAVDFRRSATPRGAHRLPTARSARHPTAKQRAGRAVADAG